ncbi:KTSC domain containing protein [uncultured Caudovirales phage]|uniref:KTSC domain containing protein n=1 Tax=uncultured Caudovirales phage TaxID=2100421 RepID=A0A6J5NJ12_9CAUD|nr:KTSC domain containing protein [uncultured Caudovirales phage]
MSTEKKFPEPQPLSDKPRPPIALEPVESNQVGAIGYDEATKTLAVQFRRGARAIYHYPGVERETFEAFKGAESIGGFFAANLKALPFEKFAAEEAAA